MHCSLMHAESQEEGIPVLYKGSYLCAANSRDIKEPPGAAGQIVPCSDPILGATHAAMPQYAPIKIKQSMIVNTELEARFQSCALAT